MKSIFIIFISLSLISCGEFIKETQSVASNIAKTIQKVLPDGYEKDINQGIVIDDLATDKLTIGMSKSQIKKTLGSPTIISPFHNNRWDYINNSKINGKKQFYQLTLFFDNDNKLIKYTQSSE